MSFRTSCPDSSSPFQIVRRSLAQTGEASFANALTPEQIQQAFAAEGVSFGNDDENVVYTMAITFWALVSQALFTGAERACRAAVIRVATYYALLGRLVGTDTAAYCRARVQITEGVLQRLALGVAERCEASVPNAWKWHGFTVKIGDGGTISMPATDANQAEYPQSTSQAAGVGFPLLRIMALISLATGMIQGLALGAYAGKETGETALLRTLFGGLQAGDLLLMDRYHCGWFMLALLRELGIEFVVRLNSHRKTDFTKGRRLGPHDHLTTWKRPQRPAWMDQETYDRLPLELEVRETHVTISAPGCRTKSLVVVTSLFDAQVIPAADLADLYRKRWNVELDLRSIKSQQELDVLRCKTPRMVRQELWTGMLAYNLTRHSMLQSAEQAECSPRQLSFTATLQALTTNWVLAALPPGTTINQQALAALRIRIGREHRVGKRPNRVEPRAIKRRTHQYKFLNVPRQVAIEKLLHPAV